MYGKSFIYDPAVKYSPQKTFCSQKTCPETCLIASENQIPDMIRTEISGTTDAGDTTDEKTNEDRLWISEEKNTVLILDGTSGTAGDFGSEGEKTGGRLYVERLTENVKETLEKNPDKKLEETLKQAISLTWDDFEEAGREEREKYFSGDRDTDIATAETVPGAVGAIVRWSDGKIELVHVGDVETYVVKKSGGSEFFCNRVHQRYDEIFEEKITELREKGVENPSESREVWDLVDKHRSAANMPGNYPNMSFNPLVVEKLGKKKKYDQKNVEKILLGTDGATTRIRELFDVEKDEVPDFVEEKGVERSIEKLRAEEGSKNLDKLKNSDDAALALIKFED